MFSFMNTWHHCAGSNAQNATKITCFHPLFPSIQIAAIPQCTCFHSSGACVDIHRPGRFFRNRNKFLCEKTRRFSEMLTGRNVSPKLTSGEPHMCIYKVRIVPSALKAQAVLRTSPFIATPQRIGISLLETVLAVAILAAALAALGHQTFVGVQASARLEYESRAALLCQSQMELLLLDDEPPPSVQNQPIPNEPGWVWSSQLLPADDFKGVQWLQVTVRKPGTQETLSRFSLSRLIPSDSSRAINLINQSENNLEKLR